MFLLFQSSFRLSEKNEKDKKRKELTPVSATPTHMLRICVNPRPTHKAQAQPTDKIKRYAFRPVSALTLSTPATPLYAGVQTMRARICSAFSCDMFARVV